MKFHPGLKIKHPYFGFGTVREITGTGDETRITVEFHDRSRRSMPAKALAEAMGETFSAEDGLAAMSEPELDTAGEEQKFTLKDVKRVLRSILNEELGITPTPMGNKWVGGKMILYPRDVTMKEKEIPLEVLFHKVVMIRDRLRVLEQRINAHPKLDDEDRIDLQQYITRVYGSLTTFNVLFREKEDGFAGEGKE